LLTSSRATATRFSIVLLLLECEAGDSARIRLRARRARSARTQSAVASTPRARPAATSTGGPITTIVDASGTVAVAREPMGGRFAMPEYVSNYCAKA